MSEAFEEFYINLIKKAERSTKKCGEGLSKSGYYCDKHIVLKSDSELYKPSEYIKKLTALKNFGLNVALPKFYISQEQVKKNGKKSIFYEVQEEAKGSFVNVCKPKHLYSHIIAFNPELKTKKINKNDLKQAYNLAMAKHRARTGLPFLSKFAFDYLTLREFGNTDMHSENVYYASDVGYTFFDIYSHLTVDPNKDIASQLKQVAKIKNPKGKPYDWSTYVYQPSWMDDFLEHTLGVADYYIPYQDCREEYFSKYVYNSVLCYQVIEALKANTPENPCYNQFFPDANEKAKKMERHPYFFDNKVFAMKPDCLLLLEEGLLNNNPNQLQLVREKCKLSENFDFSCIDIPNFLETMKLTHEFDFANPTSSQAPTSSNVDHIKVSAIDENNFDFEMV